jgi:hypothetical protein
MYVVNFVHTFFKHIKFICMHELDEAYNYTC